MFKDWFTINITYSDDALDYIKEISTAATDQKDWENKVYINKGETSPSLAKRKALRAKRKRKSRG